MSLKLLVVCEVLVSFMLFVDDLDAFIEEVVFLLQQEPFKSVWTNLSVWQCLDDTILVEAKIAD